MVFKRKKQDKNTRTKNLKSVGQMLTNYSRIRTRSCASLDKKGKVVESEKAKVPQIHRQDEFVSCSINPVASPNQTNFWSRQYATCQQKLPGTPKRPQGVDCHTQSRLESLSIDILVKILCYLHHDQLRAVFHVSQKMRSAVLLARQQHFNYTTPDRSRQEMLMNTTPVPTEHWPFVSKHGGKPLGIQDLAPKAPRHGPRPPRLHLMHLKQITSVLFQEPRLPSEGIKPPGLFRSSSKPVASNRVLLYEDEICKAVSKNTLH